MTAISALISKKWISVASDSLLTEIIKGDEVRHIEFRKSKIVPIKKFKASASYWGLAKIAEWRTYDFLKNMSVEAESFENFESFANHVCIELKKKLDKVRVPNAIDKGIGIHLAGFEKFEGEVLPELFLISNFTDTSYKSIGELVVSRNLYNNLDIELKNNENSLEEQRLSVKQYLDKGGIFIFNNGDPDFFNPASIAMNEMFLEAVKRRVLKKNDLKVYLSMASLPIEMIKRTQKDLFEKKHIRVGGQIHNLLITDKGEMISTSKDEII
ncbi:MAG: hypothetical protein PHT07_05500 [Paludibacter sp.]|nr:hypothetical protein [Paludibacter sp.]